MENLPLYISLIFIATTFLSLLFFYKACRSRTAILVAIGWMLLHGILGWAGFYKNTSTIPPRFALMIIPPVLFTIRMLFTIKGKKFLDQLDIRWVTVLHIVRVPVEMVLLFLFLHKTVPGLMTFEGRNFDILSGITAPVIYWLVFIRKTLGRKALIIWNIACLVLLINIVIIAILSAPIVIQKFAFDQPNIAVMYFPFVWLPAIVVPLVFLSHVAALRQLLASRKALRQTSGDVKMNNSQKVELAV